MDRSRSPSRAAAVGWAALRSLSILPPDAPLRFAARWPFGRAFTVSALGHGALVALAFLAFPGSGRTGAGGEGDRRATIAWSEPREVPREDEEAAPDPFEAEAPPRTPLEVEPLLAPEEPPSLVLAEPSVLEGPTGPEEAALAAPLVGPEAASLRTSRRTRPAPASAPAPAAPAPPRAPSPSGASGALVVLAAPPRTYPPEALRWGLEGDTWVELVIEPTGVVSGARLLRSSGHDVLDRDAVGKARVYRFAPIPERRVVTQPFVYRLPD